MGGSECRGWLNGILMWNSWRWKRLDGWNGAWEVVLVREELLGRETVDTEKQEVVPVDLLRAAQQEVQKQAA